MMFDDESFSTNSFSAESWLFGFIAVVRREIVRLASRITLSLKVRSRL
jgi:hypothetical protein